VASIINQLQKEKQKKKFESSLSQCEHQSGGISRYFLPELQENGKLMMPPMMAVEGKVFL
jgi:hypothetical protein